MKRTQEEAKVTRQTLLESALKVFSRNGYAKTRLEDIADDAGVTRGAIYHHFGNKRDLYLVLHEEMWMRVMPVIDSAIGEGGTSLEILRRSFVRKLQYAEEDETWRAINELNLLKIAMLPELEEGLKMKQLGMQKAIGIIAGIIRDGIDDGLIRSDVHPEETATIYYGLQEGLLSIWLIDPTQFSIKAHAELAVDIFLRGITQTGILE